MQILLPTAEALRQRLGALRNAEIEALSRRSGVPASTLWKIRSGITTNPGIETVRKFIVELEGHEANVVASVDSRHTQGGGLHTTSVGSAGT